MSAGDHDGHHAVNVEVMSDGGGDSTTQDKEASHKEWLKEMRGWLIVLATLAASVTYQAGLNPPGGFWQDNMKHAGNPVLHDQVLKRYLTFYYFNATAFVTSLVIIILLLNERFYRSEPKVAALTLTTMIDLMSLVGAYIAGSTRDMPNSIYIIVLTCFLFVCIIYMARILPYMCYIVLFTMPCLYKLAEKGCLPVTDHMKKRVKLAWKKEAEKEDEEKKRRAQAKKKKKSGGMKRCLCCCCMAHKYDPRVELPADEPSASA